MDSKKFYKEIRCHDASSVYGKLRSLSEKSFLLASRDISHIYGRLSLIGIDPVFEVRGKDEEYFITPLNNRAGEYLKALGIDLSGSIPKGSADLEESRRTKRESIADVLRIILDKFKQKEKTFLGLYGAFSYDFVRLFEDIPSTLPNNEVDDFRFCLYDTFVFFDHLKDSAEIIAYRENPELGEAAIDLVFEKFDEETGDLAFEVVDPKFELSEREYKGLVDNARELAKNGDLFEVVYSNTLRGRFEGDPFALYLKYREANPSPYLYYFDFADDQLVGASPEMMVRCENNMVHMRPISGTAPRGKDPIEDHENMLGLLKSEKERAELDMLIDLGRNDLARICKPGIEVSDYRFVEKYSKVMHTVAHVSGYLREEFSALDALIACMNAGTLTGAPKVAAMTEIEKNEGSRRGYYGGAVGYLSFSGEMDTGIIIRTAHIKNGQLSFRVGATLLYDSDPESEYKETLAKAEAFLTTIT
ncbi:MAG: anthranilate synthase component I family protein [bacterium]|nr:anthranilate synthase component I family protein [bacterium]